jgi:hypothetical protein
MTTRRAFLAGGSTLLAFATPADAAVAPHMKTPDGYSPPAASQGLLANVRFDKAVRVGRNYSDRFARWDKHVGDRHDPSNCRGIYEIPNGMRKPAVFWESKMAVDTDGATRIPGDTGTHQSQTSLMFKDGIAIDALTVPYFVVPSVDKISVDPRHRKTFPAGPWEDSGDSFESDFKIKLGNLGVIAFRGTMTGALFADTGPGMKIGEASIRVHELVRGPSHPWQGSVPRQKLDPNDGATDKILYLIFRDAFFDIEQFGSSRQDEMSNAIQEGGRKAFQEFVAAQG